MPSAPEPKRLAALAAAVGAFHLTDRPMRGAQDRVERALAAGAVDAAVAEAYLEAVRRYFEPFERLYQLEYNLTAERGVVAKRIEAVRGVLGALAELRAG